MSPSSTITATAAPVPVDIRIYDASGELVRVLAGSPGPAAVTALLFSADAVKPSGNSSVGSVDILDPATGRILASWDGRGADGALVPAGQYQVVVTSRAPGEITTVVAKLLAVLPVDTRGMGLGIEPNPATSTTFFSFGSPTATDWTLRVYTVSGEIVWRADVSAGHSGIHWDLRGRDGDEVSSGLYMVVAGPRAAGRAGKSVGRLVVVR